MEKLSNKEKAKREALEREFEPGNGKLKREDAEKLIIELGYVKDAMAASVFLDKYLLPTKTYILFKYNNQGLNVYGSADIEYYDEHDLRSFFYNITRKIYGAESKYKNSLSEERISELINNFKYFIPAGSVIAGLTNGGNTSLSNCFVVGTGHDSYNSIMQTDAHMVSVLKRRGGVGTDLSHLRSRGSHVNNAALESSGIVPFAKRYSNTILEVSQAKGRRGAGMLTLNLEHPDAEEFIDAKTNQNELNGVNISIKIPDHAMRTFAKEDGDKENDQNRLISKIVKNATKFAEPGILFWDRINEQLDTQLYWNENMDPVSTNPCGEVPLPQYDSCRLGSMNLYSYVENPFTDKAEFNIKKFEKDVYDSYRLMDDIIDLEIKRLEFIITKLESEKVRMNKGVGGLLQNDQLDEEIRMWHRIIDMAKKGRRTGIGFLGLADTVAALGLKYDGRASIDFVSDIIKIMTKNVYKSSIDMAAERGAFGVFNKSFEKGRGVEFINKVKELLPRSYIRKWHRTGRRNIQSLAIAPTGTISMMAGVSSGLEPVFSIRYKRRRRATEKSKNVFVDDNGMEWEEFNVIHPPFIEWYKTNYDGDGSELFDMDDDKFNSIVEKSPYHKSTAHEIDPYNKVIIQASLQEYIDNSISVTHNLPKGSTEKDVEKLMLFAWELGVKGFTVYVDGSRMGILVGKDDDSGKQFSAKKRPKRLYADIHTPMVHGERWLVIVGILDEKPYEVFSFKLGDKNIKIKAGEIEKQKSKVYNLYDLEGNLVIGDIINKFESPEEEFGTRLISTSLRHGADIKFICEQLDKSQGDITHFSKSISRVLKKYVKNKELDKQHNICPECGGSNVKAVDGCVTCQDCGWSKCG